MAGRTKSIANRALSMTSSDWSTTSLMAMPERELRQLYSQQRDIERKRMTALEKAGYGESGIMQRFDLAPKLSTLKTKSDIVNELKDMHRFLSMRTSTISGQKETEQRFKRAMEDIAGKRLSNNEADAMGKILDKVSAAIKDKSFKYHVASSLYSFASNKGIKDPSKFFKDVKFWAANIDKLSDVNQIKTPSGRASQSSRAYQRAINYYNKLEKFAGK